MIGPTHTSIPCERMSWIVSQRSLPGVGCVRRPGEIQPWILEVVVIAVDAHLGELQRLLRVEDPEGARDVDLDLVLGIARILADLAHQPVVWPRTAATMENSVAPVWTICRAA